MSCTNKSIVSSFNTVAVKPCWPPDNQHCNQAFWIHIFQVLMYLEAMLLCAPDKRFNHLSYTYNLF